ncbi:hypothetical protein ACFOD4_18270 [Pseudoroseomonas globiformis]|uniref:Glycosyl transferase family 2 n=1 Tax=Teichococcus globiformis TaxID=2307229 RepID=A0ABV7G9Y4_9PROT
MSLPPIVIFAFNRPDYLRRLCRSLKAQQGVALHEADIHLMQDGAVSPRSGMRFAEDAEIAANIAAFREELPRGQVHAAPKNLGIALNLHRGEALAFETLGAEVGYFFEEDLELGPHYLAMLETIRLQLPAHPRLGYFAAYGSHRHTSDPTRPRFIPLEHHWGFGLTAACWHAMQPWLAPFHTIWNESDYQGRPHLRLVETYLEKAVASAQSSQDVSKTMACAELGFGRVNLDVCYARYIGRQGQSFRDANFERHGYDAMVYADTLPDQLPILAEATLAGFIEAKRAHHAHFRAERLEPELTAMRQRLFNPDRLATRQDILDIWRVLMDRVPEEDYIARNEGQNTVRHIRSSLLRGREARVKSFFLK